MTISLEILEKEEDLDLLYPLIKKMAKLSKFPFSQLLYEVLMSLRDPNYVTFLCRDGNEIKGYATGYLYNAEEFYLSQGMKTFSEKNYDLIKTFFDFIETYLSGKGLKRILGLSIPPPAVFERYGFKLQRYLISKDI